MDNQVPGVGLRMGAQERHVHGFLLGNLNGIKFFSWLEDMYL